MASKLIIVLDRDLLQKLANTRLVEAKALLDIGMYDGAYYLSGYVIELALKACIAKKTKEYSYPDLKTVKASYTHDLSDLLKTSELEPTFLKDKKNDPQLGIYWSIVEGWSEETRYTINDKQDAEGLLNAISDKNSGVFTWIKQHW
jgi:HEPN domain-containing protein